MATKYYLYGEDLCGGLVGPFATRAAAAEHLAMWTKRGDAAVANGSAKIVTRSNPLFKKAIKEWGWPTDPEEDVLPAEWGNESLTPTFAAPIPQAELLQRLVEGEIRQDTHCEAGPEDVSAMLEEGPLSFNLSADCCPFDSYDTARLNEEECRTLLALSSLAEQIRDRMEAILMTAASAAKRK